MKKLVILLIVLSAIGLTAEYIWFNLFSSPGNSTQLEVFVVPQNQEYTVTVQSLLDKKFIKNFDAFGFVQNYFSDKAGIEPGGYKLNHNMNAWRVMKKLTGPQDLKWFSISFCARREQIGEKLTDILGWDPDKLNKWNGYYKNLNLEYFEGVYYPDTYLFPVYESGEQIAARFVSRFNEKLAPLSSQFTNKNIKWTTALKIASLIERESGNANDMKLISGIIWNRLNKNMPLQIDSTMQYTYGKNEDGTWWGSISLEQKHSDSPYNSYLNKGLPPTPICSPNIKAIDAAINPEETDCLFYLHDMNREIHCAKTYVEHKANIERFLRG